MKKLILLLLFIPLVSFGQDENVKKNEKDEYLELIKKLDIDNSGLIDDEYLSNYDEPMFRSCKNVFKSQRRECFQNKMTKHIRKHFYYPKYAFNRRIQGRVFVTFIIEKDGSISEIKTRGADKSLEKVALKIIKKLPKLIPAKYKGKPIREPVSIPITWKLG
jgi:protein TonB